MKKVISSLLIGLMLFTTFSYNYNTYAEELTSAQWSKVVSANENYIVLSGYNGSSYEQLFKDFPDFNLDEIQNCIEINSEAYSYISSPSNKEDMEEEMSDLELGLGGNIDVVAEHFILAREILYGAKHYIDGTRLEDKADYSGKLAKSVGIKDDYETKFKYNKEMVKRYQQSYGADRILTTNVGSQENAQKIIDVWQIKAAAPEGSSLATRTDMYVDENHSFSSMMDYDYDEIHLFTTLYGKTPSKLTSEEIKGVQTEWNYVLSHNGNHSPFYYKHVVVDSRGNRYFKFSGEYYEEEEKNKYEEEAGKGEDALGNTEELDSLGWEEYKEEKLLDQDKALEEARNDSASEDSDAKKIFKLPTRLAGNKGGINDAVDDAEKFVTATNETKEVFNEADLSDFSNNIYNMLLTVGIIVAVIVGVILGVKLMLAPVAERAEAKKLLIPYAIGCVIIFGAFGVWRIAVIILQNV